MRWLSMMELTEAERARMLENDFYFVIHFF